MQKVITAKILLLIKQMQLFLTFSPKATRKFLLRELLF